MFGRRLIGPFPWIVLHERGLGYLCQASVAACKPLPEMESTIHLLERNIIGDREALDQRNARCPADTEDPVDENTL